MKNVKSVDIIIIIFTIITIIIFSLFVYLQPNDDKQVVIESSQETWIYDIHEDMKIDIPGPLGETEVVIQNGSVHVHDSPCRNKICVSTGEITRTGQWIICLPNDVFVRIEGMEDSNEDKVDDVAF